MGCGRAAAAQTWHRARGAVTSLAFHPTGRVLASAGFDSRVTLWDTASGHRIVQFPRAQRRRAVAQLRSDGRLIASGDAQGRIAIWNATLHTLNGPIVAATGGVVGLAFSSDSTALPLPPTQSRSSI